MISKLLFIIGIICLGIYAFLMAEAHFRQQALEKQLLNARVAAHVKDAAGHAGSRYMKKRALKDGDLFGRLDIPRLNLSVMVMQGDSDEVLRLGAGRIPWAPLAIAGHRDTFFRPLKDIKASDTIRLTTPDGITNYTVVQTKIVRPKDTSMLEKSTPDELILVTCYPFYYIGPAPKRFIVKAVEAPND